MLAEQQCLELAAESLRISGRLRFCAQGSSMLPAIRPGEHVEIVRIDGRQTAVGDVVLAYTGGRFFLHRVVQVGDGFLVTRGDRHIVNDPPLGFDEIVGRLVRPQHTVTVTVGEMPIRIHTVSAHFAAILERRYRGFTGSIADAAHQPAGDLEVDLVEHTGLDPEQDLAVTREGRTWRMARGDFQATWDPYARRGHVRQNANPYSIDSVLRIVHSLSVVERGGFLLHSASAVRHGRAYLFSGKSGAGKTTISRLAPPDAMLLSDEISYIGASQDGNSWQAHGTPFFGELARPGENIAAPLAMACFLAKGPGNALDRLSPGQAARALLENVLFFASDETLVERVLDNVCRFTAAVPAFRLTFRPDPSVWELI